MIEGKSLAVHGVEECWHHESNYKVDFPGIHIFENFITEEEEVYLKDEISKVTFVNSQSGRRKQVINLLKISIEVFE